MLLVDDRETEAVELDTLLDERVRADQDHRFARGGFLQRSLPLLARDRAGQQDHIETVTEQLPRLHRGAVCERLEQLLHGRVVLLGENFRRRHERRLRSRCVGDQCGRDRHDRLAAADLPLQQPVHRPAARHVRRDLFDDAALRARRLER